MAYRLAYITWHCPSHKIPDRPYSIGVIVLHCIDKGIFMQNFYAIMALVMAWQS